MPDRYNNFEELSCDQQEGKDYTIEYVDRNSDMLIIAPHGGGIEFGTTQIAKGVAQENLSYYAFNGIREKGNFGLHISSARFDEPTALDALAKVNYSVSIHGAKGTEHFIYVGGLDHTLRAKISSILQDVGFTLKDPPEGMEGIHPMNIVNRNRRKKGVQLEMSRGYRNTFIEEENSLSDFTNAVRAAIAETECI